MHKVFNFSTFSQYVQRSRNNLILADPCQNRQQKLNDAGIFQHCAVTKLYKIDSQFFNIRFTVYVQVLQNITSQYPITIAPRKSLFLLLCKSANHAQRHGQIWKQHYQISFKKLSKFLQKITSCSFVCISAGQNRIFQNKTFLIQLVNYELEIQKITHPTVHIVHY